MTSADDLHADLLSYCARNGIKPSSFGQLLFSHHKFAETLERGSAPVRKAALARRFMAEHPVVEKRRFGAVAKAWRQRVAGGDTGGEGQATAPGPVANGNGLITAGTLEESYPSHNRESHAENSGGTADPALLAWIVDRMGGDEAVAAGTRTALTVVEAMRAEGRIWSQHRRDWAAFALASGHDLDPETLEFRPLGRAAGRGA